VIFVVDYMPKARKRTAPLDPDVAAGAAYQKSLNISTKLPMFGAVRFETFQNFVKDLSTYCETNYVSLRCDHSIGRNAANK
jgi:hypothetical protein